MYLKEHAMISGVTIVQTTLSANTTATGRMLVHYKQATYAQMTALVNAAAYCYMPVRYDCIATQVLGVYNNHIQKQTHKQKKQTHSHTRIHTHTHAYTQAHTCTHIRTHARTQAHTSARPYAHTHA